MFLVCVAATDSKLETVLDAHSIGENKMKYRTDLEMWHSFMTVAREMAFVSQAELHRLQGECRFYSWDGQAFEEYCNCPEIKRKNDFVADEECWKCKFFIYKETKNQ